MSGKRVLVVDLVANIKRDLGFEPSNLNLELIMRVGGSNRDYDEVVDRRSPRDRRCITQPRCT